MQYLIVDPLGSYAAHIKAFLDRLELDAVAVFSSKQRLASWQHKWQYRLGERVVGTYLADGEEPLAEIAQQIADAHPGGFAGIVPWDELSILLGAELGELLHLGWNPREVIERCRDKAVMKSWLREHGTARINASRVVRNADEALAFQQSVGSWPIVVKPSGGAGSESVFFADDPGQLLGACQEVLEDDRGAVLLEEYIGGTELAINGIVDRDHQFLVTDIWAYDKRESHGYRNLYYQSLRLRSSDPMFWQLAQYATEVVQALELRRAPVHMEVKVDDRGPCLIEVGARFAGGDQPMLASKLHGRSLFELAACHYLADLPLSPDDVHYDRYDQHSARIVSGIQSYEIPRIEVIHGVEEVEALPSFAGFGQLWPPGMRLPVTRDLNSKSYEVYLFHPDPRQVAADERAVRQLLRYE